VNIAGKGHKMKRSFSSIIILVILLINLSFYVTKPVSVETPKPIDHSYRINNSVANNDNMSLLYFSKLLSSDPQEAENYLSKLSQFQPVSTNQGETNESDPHYNGFYMNGSILDYYTKSPHLLPAFILFFKTNDTFSMSFSFKNLLGFSQSIMGSFQLNQSDQNITNNEFIAIWAISFSSNYPMISNFTFIPVDSPLETNQQFIRYNFELHLLEVGLLSLTGISHLDATSHIPKYLRGDIEVSLLTIQAYDQNNGSLLLEMPLPYVGFAIEAGSRDIIAFVPLNRTLDIKIQFNTKEVGWHTVNHSIDETLGYQNENVSFVMLTPHISNKLVENTKELEANITALGFRLDRYSALLKEIDEHNNASRYHLSISNPVYSLDEVDWGSEGNKALFEAEVSIGKCQRYTTLVTKFVSDLQRDPDINIMSIIFIMSLLLSLFIGILFFTNPIKRIVCSISTTVFIFLLNIVANSRIELSLVHNTLTLIPNSLEISIYYLFLIGCVIANCVIILSLPFLSISFSRLSLVFEFIFRNIKRQKFRSSIFILTLTMITLSFTLLVSVAYKGEVLSTGTQRDTSYEGIEIVNIQKSYFGTSLKIPQYRRIPEGLLVTINASLEIFEIRNSTSILQRDFLTGAYSTSSDNYQTSAINVTSEENVTVSIKNYFATIPSIEAQFSNLDSCITSGKWLTDSTNLTALKYSSVLLPVKLAEELQVEINDTIDFTYLSNDIFTNATLYVSGFINTTQMASIVDIDGGTIIPSTYDFNSEGRINGSTPCKGNEFIILDFLWWRYARAASYSEQLEFAHISRFGSTKMILNATDMDLAFHLADRLEGYSVKLSSNGIISDLEFAIVQSIEGLIPQLLPILIAIPIIFQSVFNSLWERRKEIQIYGTIGMPIWSLVLMIIFEFGILAIVSGALGYLLGLLCFPVLSEFELAQFLTQKTDSVYAILSFLLSISISSLATLPFMVKVVSEIIPRKDGKQKAYLFSSILVFNEDLPYMIDTVNSVGLKHEIVDDSRFHILNAEKSICTFNFDDKNQIWRIETYDKPFESQLKRLEKKLQREKSRKTKLV